MKLIRGEGKKLRLYSAPIVTTDKLVIRRRLYRNRKTVPVKLTTPKATSSGWQFAAPVSVAGEPSRSDVPYVRTSPQFTRSATAGGSVGVLMLLFGADWRLAIGTGLLTWLGLWLESDTESEVIEVAAPVEEFTPDSSDVIGKFTIIPPSRAGISDYWPISQDKTAALVAHLEATDWQWSRRKLSPVLSQDEFGKVNAVLTRSNGAGYSRKLIHNNEVSNDGQYILRKLAG